MVVALEQQDGQVAAKELSGKGQGKQDLLKLMAKTTMMMVMVMELFDG